MVEMTLLSKLRFPAKAYQLKEIRFIVQQAMKKIGCVEEEVDEIVLAINEACMNVIQHGYCTEADDHTCGEIIVEIFDDVKQILFKITDFSQPVDLNKIKSRQLDDIKPGGLGVHFINEIMDSVEYVSCDNGQGNILELRKNLLCRK